MLQKELIDLGLPKENVESITKTYKNNREKLLEKSTEKMLKSTKKAYIESFNLQVDYSIHEILGSSRLCSETIFPIRFAEVNFEFQSLEGSQNKSMIVCEEELD